MGPKGCFESIVVNFQATQVRTVDPVSAKSGFNLGGTNRRATFYMSNAKPARLFLLQHVVPNQLFGVGRPHQVPRLLAHFRKVLRYIITNIVLPSLAIGFN
jgi:hypothetical protein